MARQSTCVACLGHGRTKRAVGLNMREGSICWRRGAGNNCYARIFNWRAIVREKRKHPQARARAYALTIRPYVYVRTYLAYAFKAYGDDGDDDGDDNDSYVRT